MEIFAEPWENLLKPSPERFKIICIDVMEDIHFIYKDGQIKRNYFKFRYEDGIEFTKLIPESIDIKIGTILYTRYKREKTKHLGMLCSGEVIELNWNKN